MRFTYPSHDPQPYTGDLPTMVEAGTSDTLYSSGTAHYYQSKLDAQATRQLAGTGNQGNSSMDKDNAWAVNELAVLAELDDVQGNGIFDPPGTHPNIWPDAGVFAASYSLPGYHAREKMFSPSEVRDATTGRQIVPVPSGAVAIDNVAIIAQMEKHKYQAPEQLMRLQDEYPVMADSTVNAMVTPLPIHGFGAFGEEAPPTPAVQTTSGKFLLGALVLGMAGSAFYVFTRKKGHRSNRRKR